MNTETWVNVNGFEMYEVSSHGNIRTSYINSRLFDKENKTKKLKIGADGYYQVQLYNSTSKKTFRVNRLVAIHFLENNNNYPVVNHKDGNKLNNYVDNLEWCTLSHNGLHAYANNLVDISKFRGANNKNTKIANDDVIVIRKMFFEDKIGQITIAEKFNVSKNLISAIMTGRTWGYIQPEKLKEYKKLMKTKRKN